MCDNHDNNYCTPKDTRAARRDGDSWKAKMYRQKDVIMAPVENTWFNLFQQMSQPEKDQYTDYCINLRRLMHNEGKDITEGQYYGAVDRLQKMFDMLNKYK